MPSRATLEAYREYPGLLGRLQLDEQLVEKVDVSGAVQITMHEAQQASGDAGIPGRRGWRRVGTGHLNDVNAAEVTIREESS